MELGLGADVEVPAALLKERIDLKDRLEFAGDGGNSMKQLASSTKDTHK